MATQFSAEQARLLTATARAINGEYKRAETTSLLEQIQKAAQKGLNTISTTHTDEVIVDRLKALGYNVVYTPAYDQRDDAYNTISW